MKDHNIDLKDWISDKKITILTRKDETNIFRKIYLIVIRSYHLINKTKVLKDHLEDYSKNLYQAEKKFNLIQKYLLNSKYLNTVLTTLKKEFNILTDQLISHNLRLIISIVRKYYSKKGVEFFDLIHEGGLGVLVALFKFDYTLNCKFSTYSIHWIKQRMFRCVNDNMRVVKLPMHTVTAMYLSQDIVEKGWKEDKEGRFVRRIHYLPKKKILLEKNLQDNDYDTPSLQDSLENKNIDNDYQIFVKKSKRNFITKILNTIDPIAERLMRLKFGLNRIGEHTNEEIKILLLIDDIKLKKIESTWLRKLKQQWKQKDKISKIETYKLL